MADGTKIQWTDATWNPVVGCEIESPGCAQCYAMKLAGTRLKHTPSRQGLTRDTKAGPVWTGEVRFMEEWLDQPLHWRRPRDVFVCAHSDLFYRGVQPNHRARIFTVMRKAHWHRFQVLTKRPDEMRAFCANLLPYDHVWLGVSVERQQEADQRRPWLRVLAETGWNTWVSYEPALGPVDWSGWEFIRGMVSGGESNAIRPRDARPTHPDWHRATRDWCAAHEIPFHFKQWGEYTPSVSGTALAPDGSSAGPDHWHDRSTAWMRCVGKKAAGALLDGREHRDRPWAATS